jgi:hypothetical protein
MIPHESGSIDSAFVISISSDLPLFGDDRSGSLAENETHAALVRFAADNGRRVPKTEVR